MMKSDISRDDNIGKMVNSAGRDRAPEGFTSKVMSRIELEALSVPDRYKNPIGKNFLIVSSLVFLILILLAATFQWAGWSDSSLFSFIKLPEIHLPDYSAILNRISGSNIPLYILLPALLAPVFYLFDNFLYSLFSSKYKRA